MKDIVIVGAGHLGQDAYNLIGEINEIAPTWKVVGFLNDVPAGLERYGIEEPIVGPIKGWVPRENEAYVLAIGSTAAKEKIANEFLVKGAEFPALISPKAHVNKTAIIEEGAMILSTSKIGARVRIGRFAVVGDTTISMESELGDFSNTASYANIYRNVKIGKRVQIWSNSVILNSVGDDAVVGAGSVVVSKVKPGTHVFGVPAKKMEF